MRGGLVVSCQPEAGGHMDDPSVVRAICLACLDAGAVGVRVQGERNVRAVSRSTDSPVVSLVKRSFPDGSVCITRKQEDFEALVGCGARIIAVDGTERVMDGMSGPEFIARCAKQFPETCVLADIADEKDALACLDAGAAAVATTLRGHTRGTLGMRGCDPDFIGKLSAKGAAVVAEGGIKTPEDMRSCLESGAIFCVVGEAITGAERLVSRFVSERFAW